MTGDRARAQADGAAAGTPRPVTLHGWGGAPGAAGWVLRPARGESVAAALRLFRERLDDRDRWTGVLPRGMGRSYGDAAQLAGGLVLDTGALKGFELDAASGVVTAAAGVTIGELLEQLVPKGWMVPVVPGTQHVSVGGAIASDIHGKNHGVAGTFGSHVLGIGLMTAAGEEVALAPGDELFQATLGGMGLTGAILWARIQFTPVSSPFLSVDTDRVADLDEALAALTEPGGPHRVAWLDLLGPRAGRGIVTRAAFLPGDEVPRGQPGSATVAARATVPAGWPGVLLAPASIRAFNELRFRRSPARERGQIESIGAHMFPLDALDAWPRLYGRHGFLQYQLVVPYGSEGVISGVIEQLRRARIPCYLAVLKDFGEANAAPLSFPLAGWTITLDLPRAASGLGPTLDRCDELVAQAGGRVYLSKDIRMRPEALRAMYPRLEEWRAVRDQADPERVWRSDLADRTGLVSDQAPGSESRVGAFAAGGRGAAADAERRVLLIGGTSEIGLAIVSRLASDGGVRPFLLGRDRDGLTRAAASLEQAGGARAEYELLDADDFEAHEQAVADAFKHAGGFDVVVLAVGVLGAQAGLDADRDEAARVMRVNFLGGGSLLLAALRRLRDQGHGTLVVLSSAAVERPRAANAVYGAAKTGLDALAQGLSDAVAGSGVRVLVVRPGFVRTRMTEGLKPAPFATTAEAVADATVGALRGTEHTIWVPKVLRYVFAVLRHLPRPLYRRLPL